MIVDLYIFNRIAMYVYTLYYIISNSPLCFFKFFCSVYIITIIIAFITSYFSNNNTMLICLMFFDRIVQKTITNLYSWEITYEGAQTFTQSHENYETDLIREEEKEDERIIIFTCQICYTHKKRIVYEPCFHSVCRCCNSKMMNLPCPVCRTAITKRYEMDHGENHFSCALCQNEIIHSLLKCCKRLICHECTLNDVKCPKCLVSVKADKLYL